MKCAFCGGEVQDQAKVCPLCGAVLEGTQVPQPPSPFLDEEEIEQEANFAAYLACAQSSDVRFAYAGAYNAFCYCFNALYRMDADRALQLLQDDADAAGEGVALLWGDRLATHEHYAAYDGPFEKVGTTVNDHYLKSFGETSGVRSYGLVVDYLIAWQLADEA